MTYLIKILFLLLILWTIPIFAAQHALVVGINHYQYADDREFLNLRGAVNDAVLLQNALRGASVSLPDKRILLDNEATRHAFDIAWQDMLNTAHHGDTLILTFSGHGGQIPDNDGEETDQYDEMLLFHDFNPRQPHRGSLIDDEMYQLLKTASANYNIVIVVDACHSSGSVRSMAKKLGRVRNGGRYKSSFKTPRSYGRSYQREQPKLPSNVTRIMAVNSDHLKVPEITIDDKWHGALSWFFAKALRGEADGNHNGRLERKELDQFLREKVSDYMENVQTPKLLPDADQRSVLSLPTYQKPVISHKNITIVVENAPLPKGLKHVRAVNASQSFDLRFVVNHQQTDVFNRTGDKVTTLPTHIIQLWQRVIDKERLLKKLATQFDMALTSIKISLRDGDKTYKKGEKRYFQLEPSDKTLGLNALTVFNLAGNGKLQFLYPLSKYGDPLECKFSSKYGDPLKPEPLKKEKCIFPYELPAMLVTKPFGGDDLVVILCQKPVISLHYFLAKNHEKIKLPEPEQFLRYLHNNTCQVGQHAFFSSK